MCIRDRSALWQYSENLYFLPLNPPEPQTAPLTGPEIARVLLETQRFGFCDVMIDAGASSSATASLWRKCADIVVTVTEADHNSLLRLSRTPLEDNDVLLLNKIEPESTVMREIITYLSTEKRFQPHLAPMRILWDEAAARAGIYRSPVAEAAPFSQSGQALGAFATWLRLRAAGRCQS